MRLNLRDNRGNFTVEYAILLPVIFAVVIAGIVVFLIFYQGALLQNTAENLAEALARQWNYGGITNQEMISGVYQKSTFDEREIYWNLKSSRSKERAAQEYCQKLIENLGFFRFYKYSNPQVKPKVVVNYSAGILPEITVSIEASYVFPGSDILRIFGLGDILKIKANAQCNVHSAKDMINATDYILQMLRETELYEALDEKFQDIRNSIEKVIR
ncbi:MAG: pilus assembly protein [Clostridiaceae bacterium]|nr:pilus assembly protein [Clostridiaceae bacterium]